MTTPLSVLDLSPFGVGQTPGDGLRATIRLAQRAEALGYTRYWLAEHHLNPGVAGASPHALLPLLAASTRHIRVGTAASIIGNSRPLQVVEAFGTTSALHPGRVDLGIGRSGSLAPGRSPFPEWTVTTPTEDRVVDGLLIPAPRPFPFDSVRFATQARLLGRAEGDGERFEQDVHDILDLIAGSYLAPEGVPIHATPAEREDIQVWLHGSTAGQSAELAGRLGLPFGANYHVAPSLVLEAVTAYRRAFVPGRIPEPYVSVSVDVLVSDTDAEARRLGAGFDRWVHSIRAGQGAIVYPTPADALAHPLPEAERPVVADRLATRFVGSPATVAERLDTLGRVTAADELVVTTIAHDPRDRERSYELLAEVWGLVPAGRPAETTGVRG